METMMRHVGFQHGDSAKDLIDSHDFLARFAATFKTDVTIAGKQVEKDQWASIALNNIAQHVMRVSLGSAQDAPTTWKEANVDDRGMMFKKVFKQWDKNGDGILSIKEFVDGLKQIPNIDSVLVEGKKLDDEKFKRIVEYIDVSSDGTINYLEFIKALSVEDKMGTMSNALAEDITTTLFRNKTALLAACQFFDLEKSSKITMDQFGDALEAVSVHLKAPESPFTFHQIHRLASSAMNEKGEVKYVDFVNAFEIIDTLTSQDKKHNGVARTIVREKSLVNYK
jgi:hypothetical protein